MDYEYNKIFTFLQVPKIKLNFVEHFIGKQSTGITKDTFNLLKQIYFQPNLELFDLLGYRIEEWL